MTISVDWEITKRCNESCNFCLNASGPGEIDILSTEECLAIIDQLVALGTFHMVITGGEPFIRPDIVEIFEYAASKHLIWTVTTNGSLLTPSLLDSLVPIRANFRSLQVSLHSLDPNTYKSYGISEVDLNNTRKGIGLAAERGFTTTAICLFNGENEDEVLEVYDWCTQQGLYGFISSQVKQSGRAQLNSSAFHYETERWYLLLERLFAASREGGRPKLLISEPPLIQDYSNKKLGTDLLPYSCPAGKDTFMIKANGDIYPCPFISHDCTGRVESHHFCAGNIRSDKLKDLLHSNAFQRFNNNVEGADTFYGEKDVKCGSCSRKSRGQCRPCQLGKSDCHDSVKVVTEILKRRHISIAAIG